MKLYGPKNCDTCQKAQKQLLAVGFEADFVDVRATPLSPDQIEQFLEAFGAALLNTRSTTWRGLSEEERSGEPKTLLADYPALMKRPVSEGPDGLTLGWGKDVQGQYLTES